MGFLKTRNLAFGAVVMLMSCSSHDRAVILQLEENLNAEFFSQAQVDFSQVDKILIIPRVGCSSCIGNADYFFKQDFEKRKSFYFVFTKVESLKTLRVRFQDHDFSHDQVYIDKQGSFSKGELDSIYPLLVELENKKVERVTFLTPDKASFYTDQMMN